MSDENPNWLNNNIQFPRLISEIYSTINFSEEQIKALEDSMNLPKDYIFDIFQRADEEWQKIKANTAKDFQE